MKMVCTTGMSLEPVLDATSVGILAVDARGMVFSVNKAAEKLLRTSREEILRRRVLDVLPGTGQRLLESLRSGNPLDIEKIQNGSASLILRADPIILDGRAMGVVAIFEEAPHETSKFPPAPSYDMMKNWLDAIIDSSYDGLWICDHEGTVLRINKASERISGIKAEDVVGKNMRELVSSGLYDKSVTFEVLRKKTSVTMVQQIRGKKKVLITGNPVFDDQGEIRFVVTNSRDLTEFESLKHQLEETKALAQSYRSRLSELEMRDVDLSSVVYRSEAMQRVLELAIRVAKVDSTVLLLGESGVGKGLIAKLIHKHSNRGHGPFVRVDCAGIPDTLIESELFGYEKGAFTGARTEGKPGFFELADKGTLFLDEIAELPVGSQSKLLRFLEDHELFRVGGTTPRTIDARVIAATNRNLEQMVSTRLFREDLYYRLNVVPLPIPPLRNRPEDILPLLFHFLKLFNERYHRNKTLSTAALDAICAHPFPGNVRELSNLVERLVVATEDDLIDLDHLPDIYRQRTLEGLPFPELSEAPSLKEALKRYEALLIEKVVKKCGSRRKAAKILKVNHTTITRKLNRCRVV
jgi:PAS domain S-box-containing protein/TyrR family helix-turn-helix protein